jgi:AAA15 family ATPase/GTPase
VLVSSIDISEFRGILRCREPISLSKFTVLLGRNNSGKSSVLEALSLFPDFRNEKSYLDDNMVEYLTKLHGGYDSLIYGYSGAANLKFRVNEHPLSIRLSDERRIFFEGVLTQSDENELVRARMRMPRIPLQRSREDLIDKRLAEMIGISGINNVKEGLSDTTFFVPNDSSFMDNLQLKLSNEKIWNQIIKKGANTRVIRLVNKCVDDKYTEVLRTPELSARKERGKECLPLYVKIKDLGDGIQKVVTTGLWLEALNPKLVLWDDFEGSAHPSLIKALLEWIAEKPWQVIMSTHSFDVLVSLLDVRPKDTQVIQLKKTEDDVLIHNKLSLEELEDTIDSSQDPRKMVDLLGL